jgi:tRNA G18 (ribose-2'-O)-methylase SpoU
MKLNSKKLRTISPEKALRMSKKIKKADIYLVLENVLDTYNVGGFFRLADAIGAKKIYLCGATGTPPDVKIKRSSVGTYKFILWEHKNTVREAMEELKKIKNMKIVAIEQSRASVDYRRFAYQTPLTFVLGNETYGLEKKTQRSVDAVVEIPMYGINKSLNVMVAAGVVMYYALSEIKK